MKVRMPFLNELSGSVEKKVWKAGTTARTYKKENKIRWISIGKRPVRKKPWTTLQALRRHQIEILGDKYQCLSDEEKEQLRRQAEEENTTPFALFFKQNMWRGEYYLKCTADTCDAEDAPDINQDDDEALLISNIRGERGNLYVNFNCNLIPTDKEITEAKLYIYYYDWDISDPYGETLVARLIKSNWSEKTETWNHKPYCYGDSWNEATIPQPHQYIEIDVTSDMQILREHKKAHGWKVHFKYTENEENGSYMYILPREYFCQGKAPYLKIKIAK